MDRQVRVNYNEKADTLFVFVDGIPSNTWNLSMNPYWVVRFDPTVSEIMGYFVNSASKVVPKAVNALKRGGMTDLVEAHFTGALDKDNAEFQEAKRRAAEKQAEQKQEKAILGSLDLVCK